jgi:hypothetical protein
MCRAPRAHAAARITFGSLIQCFLGLIMLSRDFKLPLRGIGRLTLESLSASVIGGSMRILDPAALWAGS